MSTYNSSKWRRRFLMWQLWSMTISLILIASWVQSTVIVSPAGGNVPTGGIILVNSGSCPAGYGEVTALRGRYPVGTPLSGTVGGTSGTSMTNLENRSVGQHTHVQNGGVGGTMFVQGSGTVLSAAAGLSDDVTPVSTQASGAVAGTNAPYQQVLFCSKT